MVMRPVAKGVFTEGDSPSLIGGRRREDGRLVFPMPSGNDAQFYDAVQLSRRGRLWSYTVQRFRPKSPPYAGREAFEPYAVGYVELPNQLIVESRLDSIAFEDLHIGMQLELTTIPFAVDPDGTAVTTFAFRPAQGAAA